jgi:hypothetical protein
MHNQFINDFWSGDQKEEVWAYNILGLIKELIDASDFRDELVEFLGLEEILCF